MDGTPEEPAAWALRLSKSEGTKSAAGLARDWMRTYEQLVERMPHDRHAQSVYEWWEARHKAVLALEAIGFKGGR